MSSNPFLGFTDEELKNSIARNLNYILGNNIHFEAIARIRNRESVSLEDAILPEHILNSGHLIDRLGAALNAALVLGGYTWDAKGFNDQIVAYNRQMRKEV